MDERPSPTIKEAAARGFSNAADAYASSRPSYPHAAIAYVVEKLNISSESHLVDLGAGTGLLTGLFLPTTRHVTAIEPVPEMRDKLIERFPEVSAIDGTAERIPLDAASVDAVVVGQAFHWFEPEDALREIDRVLRPSGGLALLWNVRDMSVDWMQKYEAAISRYRSKGRTFDSPEWRVAVETTVLFDEFAHQTFPYTQTLTRDGFLTRLRSTAYVASRPEKEQEDLVQEVREVIDSDPGLAGSDGIAIPYETHVYWSRKKN